MQSSFTAARCHEYCLFSAGAELEKRRPDTWLSCTKETERRQHLRIGWRVNYMKLIGTNSGARKLAEWIIRLGRLDQFSLAKRLLYS